MLPLNFISNEKMHVLGVFECNSFIFIAIMSMNMLNGDSVIDTVFKYTCFFVVQILHVESDVLISSDLPENIEPQITSNFPFVNRFDM